MSGGVSLGLGAPCFYTNPILVPRLSPQNGGGGSLGTRLKLAQPSLPCLMQGGGLVNTCRDITGKV